LSKVLWKGIGFGLTSGVITTLGVIVGLHSGTQSRIAVLVGILVVSLADAFSDAMGIHVSEEAEHEHTAREQWESAFFTFMSKLLVALSFTIPVILLELYTAMFISVAWGLLLIATFSISLARSQGHDSFRVTTEHVLITLLVVLLAHYLGDVIHGALVV
jgi:VIT1/CCC1 family predicted Fe2+/Mn2+ transporter